MNSAAAHTAIHHISKGYFPPHYTSKCPLLLSCLARSKPGDWHPYHWPACDRV